MMPGLRGIDHMAVLQMANEISGARAGIQVEVGPFWFWRVRMFFKHISWVKQCYVRDHQRSGSSAFRAGVSLNPSFSSARCNVIHVFLHPEAHSLCLP